MNQVKINFIKMKKISLLGIACVLFFVQCKKSETDPFLITSDKIGKLPKATIVKQLDSIFANDSLVKINSSPNAIETQGEVEIYEKGGKRLLLLTPKEHDNPNAKIIDVLIYDTRYRTEDELNIESKFKDFKNTYEIATIQRTLNNVLVFFTDSNLYLTIDARHLTPEVRTNLRAELEAAHIFEDAPIKYLRLDWDSE